MHKYDNIDNFVNSRKLIKYLIYCTIQKKLKLVVQLQFYLIKYD